MTFPAFYQPTAVGTLFTPHMLEVVRAGRDAALTPASDDQTRIALLLIDMQVDFIHPQGSLSVPGAVDDTIRTIEWLYTNLSRVTTVAASLDSHLPIQIFSSAWWMDRDGNYAPPYTVITHDAVVAGDWIPLYDEAWSRTYTEILEDQARKQLMIWPYHTLSGTPGHNLMPALYEAIAYHASARSTQPLLLPKGSEPRTEYYSILEPEVKLPGNSPLNFNQAFMDQLAQHDLIYIAGQAKSHCVLETVSSFMRHGDAAFIGKLRLLTDAMSSVQHPEIDFDTPTTALLEQFAQQGLTLTTTQEAL